MNVRPLLPEDTARVIEAGLGLSRLPRGDGSFYLVAWNGDEPLGHAHLALGDPPELQDVSVLPAHRRRGVATAWERDLSISPIPVRRTSDLNFSKEES